MPSMRPLLAFRRPWEPSAAPTTVHRWSAVPLSDHWSTGASSAVDMSRTPRTLPLLTLRSRSAVPSTTSSQSWSAVPLSFHWRAGRPSAVDMFWTPSTSPLPALSRRNPLVLLVFQ